MKEEKIKKFIECLIPVTACNLRCDYCYVIQQGRRKDEIPKFKYSPEHIGKALTKERLGGTCYISICGAGETLIPNETVDIVREILKQGHFVNITTNGTMTPKINKLMELPSEHLERLHFAFSFHYLELVKRNLLDIFFENVKNVRKHGCSFVVQLNLYDKYMPYIDEIKEKCIKEIGAYPQIAATRDDSTIKSGGYHKLYTSKTREEYLDEGRKFKSPLFEFTMKNFKVKRREFCYAGDWSLILNLSTGNVKRCYSEKEDQNIFEDINKPIKFKAVGSWCKSQFCFNSSHFMSLGIIPSIKTPTYAGLRNREEANWYNERTKRFLSSKLEESNKKYSAGKKFKIDSAEFERKVLRKLKIGENNGEIKSK